MVNLESDFKKCSNWAEIWFDKNYPDNILRRFNLLKKSSEVKIQFRVKFSNCSDWLQIIGIIMMTF